MRGGNLRMIILVTVPWLYDLRVTIKPNKIIVRLFTSSYTLLFFVRHRKKKTGASKI